MSKLERRRSASPRARTENLLKKSREVQLPFGAKSLSKYELEKHYPLLALYLLVQKQIEIDSLDEREVKGRWKSFVKKWNTGDLSRGWYDPSTRKRAEDEAAITCESNEASRSGTNADQTTTGDADSDDDFGPRPPSLSATTKTASNLGKSSTGPVIPNESELDYRDEIIAEDMASDRTKAYQERKAHHKLTQARLDELVPKSDAGTHERRIEKKRDLAAVRASYKERRSPGAEDINDGDLMGGADTGIEGYQKRKQDEVKKKSAWQVRREEIDRARTEARRERLRGLQEKEDQTIAMLRELAKQKYGTADEE